MYPKAGRMQECPIPRSSDGTSGKFPPRSLKSQTKKYTFINDDDQNTNTSTKSENSKKDKFKEGNGNGKEQAVDEVQGQDRSDPSINDIVTDSDTDTDTDTNVIDTDTDTDTDNNDTWETYCMKCFTSRFHKVTVVLFALANILQYYSFLQAINFEYVNAILFIHSVVCNWFLEDSITDMKAGMKVIADMKAGMKVIENKLEGMGNKLEAEKSNSAASKVENEIWKTAVEAELKQKVNKIGYQDTISKSKKETPKSRTWRKRTRIFGMI